jgi:DNA-binding NtrC family response regulator
MNASQWKIRILDPSGETRTLPIHPALAHSIVGRGEAAAIPLRDPTLPWEVATVWAPTGDRATAEGGSPFWFRAAEGMPHVKLGELEVREGRLPEGLEVWLGETRMRLERDHSAAPQLPPQPAGIRPWMSRAESGRQTLWTVRKAAATPLSVYLAGETGTGKEVLAQLVHSWSPRSSGPFVPLHCGALAMSLVESELFGHVKGAFTGASSQRPGALLQAHGGTLFLDEVGDLPMDIQVKLLRFLENGEIRPVGSDRTTRADVRLVCATHKPLLKLVEEGRFRQDLYFRLASVTIEIPALRERPQDIEMLAMRFAGDLRKAISPRALLRLKAHSWPGNVRELRHAIERACGLAEPTVPILGEEDFEFLLNPAGQIGQTQELNSSILTLDEMERRMILKALKLSHGHRGDAAALLGIARSTLFEMLKRHRIQGPRAARLVQPAINPEM